MPQLRQELLLDRPDLERGKMTQGVYDLIEQVTIASPINDLLHGNASLKREALAYLRQEGLYKRAPFTPPEWITEALGTMTPEQIEALKKCKDKGEAYRLLYEHRHSRISGQDSRKRRGGRHVRDEVHQERLRLAPNMTPKQFAAHFHVSLVYAYAWNRTHGDIMRRTGTPGQGRPRRKG